MGLVWIPLGGRRGSRCPGLPSRARARRSGLPGFALTPCYESLRWIAALLAVALPRADRQVVGPHGTALAHGGDRRGAGAHHRRHVLPHPPSRSTPCRSCSWPARWSWCPRGRWWRVGARPHRHDGGQGPQRGASSPRQARRHVRRATLRAPAVSSLVSTKRARRRRSCDNPRFPRETAGFFNVPNIVPRPSCSIRALVLVVISLVVAAPALPPGRTAARLSILRALHALDCDRLDGSEASVALAGLPAPRIVILHGSVPIVTMEPFARFLIGWAIREASLRDPSDGSLTQSSFGGQRGAGGHAGLVLRARRPAADADRTQPGRHARDAHAARARRGLLRPSRRWSTRSRARPCRAPRSAIPYTGASGPSWASVSFAAAIATGKLAARAARPVDDARQAAPRARQHRGIHGLRDRLGSRSPATGPRRSPTSPPAAPACATCCCRRATAISARRSPSICRQQDAHPGIRDRAGGPMRPPPRCRGGIADLRNLELAADLWYSVRHHWCTEGQRRLRAGAASRPMKGKLNLFQAAMLRWRGMYPYNAVHVAELPGDLDEASSRRAIDAHLTELGIGAALARCAAAPLRVRRRTGARGVARLRGARQHAGDPRARDGTAYQRALRPRGGQESFEPLRFFAVRNGGSFHVGVAYDHFIAGGDSMVALLQGIAARYDGTLPAGERAARPVSARPTRASSRATRSRSTSGSTCCRACCCARAARSARAIRTATASTTRSPRSSSPQDVYARGPPQRQAVGRDAQRHAARDAPVARCRPRYRTGCRRSAGAGDRDRIGDQHARELEPGHAAGVRPVPELVPRLASGATRHDARDACPRRARADPAREAAQALSANAVSTCVWRPRMAVHDAGAAQADVRQELSGVGRHVRRSMSRRCGRKAWASAPSCITCARSRRARSRRW